MSKTVRNITVEDCGELNDFLWLADFNSAGEVTYLGVSTHSMALRGTHKEVKIDRDNTDTRLVIDELEYRYSEGEWND